MSGLVETSRGPEPKRAEDMVYEGEHYTVTGEREFDDGLSYQLAERRPENWYGATRFIPVSDISETEFVRQEIKQPAIF